MNEQPSTLTLVRPKEIEVERCPLCGSDELQEMAMCKQHCANCGCLISTCADL
jgi:hypothetical protein